ncbi:TetR/AcrR family transcriptional regulator [Pseudonocardia endophytica]|uniref:TetR family transcriptional regulator n=1 Tax=Pseudonocardia endophytica TaxID=401976 RepID=A0A4R1HGQ1_PSEEN|nr:TetR/AcrR family transcriptional regulator [Pseudonocardia endophytica]TCK21364.1 TetR family transcriptional regulator [Pseudonocardia endophytica]
MPRVPVEERRRQLVAAAFRVIGREGFAAATTRRVCAEAGAPLAAFHYCFDSKQALLVELTEQTLAELVDIQTDGIVVGSDVAASLRATLREYWRGVEADPNRESVLMALTQHALADPKLAGVAEAQYEAYHRTARTVLETIADACGVTWSLPLGRLSRMLIVVTDGVTLAWLVDRDGEAALAALDAFADQVAALAQPIGDP